MSQAASLDWPAFSTLDRLVNRIRVEVRVWLRIHEWLYADVECDGPLTLVIPTFIEADAIGAAFLEVPMSAAALMPMTTPFGRNSERQTIC
jgi:hypothetical protein